MTDRHLLGLKNTSTLHARTASHTKAALRTIIVATLGAGFIAACGGGGTDDTGGSGGSGTGSGGTATGSGGNATGSGGNATGSGGNDTSSGGAASGGTTSSGGEGGLGGNDGGNGQECPTTLPGPEDACEGGFNAPTCTYGDQECTCEGFGQNGTWECNEAGANDADCPDELPGPEEACEGGFQAPTCTYDDQECTCEGFGDNAVWECGEPVDTCPASPPGEGDACTEQQLCDFDGSLCVCDGENWTCL